MCFCLAQSGESSFAVAVHGSCYRRVTEHPCGIRGSHQGEFEIVSRLGHVFLVEQSEPRLDGLHHHACQRPLENAQFLLAFLMLGAHSQIADLLLDAGANLSTTRLFLLEGR